MKTKYQKGDIIVCLPGFIPQDNTDSDRSIAGGSAYAPYRIHTITRITKHDYDMRGDVIWVESGGGVWSHAVRLATPGEIEKYYNNNITHIDPNDTINNIVEFNYNIY